MREREKNTRLFNQLMSSFVKSCPSLVQLELNREEGWLAGVCHPTMTRLRIAQHSESLPNPFTLPNLSYLNLGEGLDDERFVYQYTRTRSSCSHQDISRVCCRCILVRNLIKPNSLTSTSHSPQFDGSSTARRRKLPSLIL
jgi:hypothetical protein